MTEGLRSNLPRIIPVFPLSGVILMPGTELPLNIFEPRYLSMVRDALAGPRFIGLIQPMESEKPGHPPRLYKTGCVGQIRDWSETDDGRILITLFGVNRFDVAEEIPAQTLYRQVTANYELYASDGAGNPYEEEACAELRPNFLATLKRYLDHAGIKVEWGSVEAAPVGAISAAFAMVSPFAAAEKQAILEAPNARERCRTMAGLMTMALHDGSCAPQSPIH